MKEFFIGVDFGGTNLKLGCFDGELNLVTKTSVPSGEDLSPQAVIANISSTIHSVLSQHEIAYDQVKAVGLGIPGQMNLTDGIILSAPNLPFENVPMKRLLSEKLDKTVIMENDANAAAWGEFVAGAGSDVNHMVFFTLGTGIGGGIICDGKLVHGYTDEAAELGHILIYVDGERQCGCGQYGCAEAYGSASATADRANDALKAGVDSSLNELFKKDGSVTCEQVFDHAKNGDKFANEIVDGTAKTLGILCIDMLHVTQPQRILFAGGMIGAGDFLLEKIQKYFDKYIWTMKPESLEICFATLGEDAGIIGSAALAKDHFKVSKQG
ncbi:Glucokinase [Anaerohalosphaera lusitana]|uniref:Glucokinase n=1 Tax=Anaerohalosphaera lusitana TaxID=1936003 RepID=A0A1U9NN14_9BACT|nr:ROK family glucokinase [Anaerohalosphaera lusitana]AQT69225.1 Glucokinase [Anaerohalosphaera lusitana]